jgi:V8-like Glu-specific endopeptidase
VQDWGSAVGDGQGRLVQLQAYVGYTGKTDIKSPRQGVQVRSGKRVATTAGYLKAAGNRAADFALIELDKPFTGVTPFKWADTPSSANLELGVVGYPGDKFDTNSPEHGAEMWEHFLPVQYDLAKSNWRTISYMIDTYGGKSS